MALFYSSAPVSHVSVPSLSISFTPAVTLTCQNVLKIEKHHQDLKSVCMAAPPLSHLVQKITNNNLSVASWKRP